LRQVLTSTHAEDLCCRGPGLRKPDRGRLPSLVAVMLGGTIHGVGVPLASLIRVERCRGLS
jgi:hypothetical protein